MVPTTTPAFTLPIDAIDFVLIGTLLIQGTAALNRSRSAETGAGPPSSGAVRSAGPGAGAVAERGGSAHDFSSDLGHVRRLDLPSHLVGRLACALYWFHPLVWLAARRARVESERACDDLVLSAGTRPSAYAEHLLQIASGAAKATAPVVAIPMAQRKEFEGRMVAILEPGVPRRGPNRRQAATLAGSVALFALAVASMAPIRAESSRAVTNPALRTAAAPPAGPTMDPTMNPAARCGVDRGGTSTGVRVAGQRRAGSAT